MRLQTYVKNNGNYTKSQTMALQNASRILVNGQKVNLSYDLVNDDIVTIDGKVIENIPYVYYIYNKPKDVICTNDENIVGNIKTTLGIDKRVYPVGRLDKDSHGLLILTNDNKFCHEILKKDNHIEKEYLVKVKYKIDDAFISNMSKSIILDGKETLPCKVKKVDDYSYLITLKEGRYHQIKKMAKYHQNQVVDLFRTRIGKISLYENYPLKEGNFQEINNLIEII